MPIVTGRHKNIPRNERFCTLCDKNQIGDEVHCLFQCGFFVEERKKHMKRYYWKYPNTLKMEKLFNSEKKSTLSNLATFCRIIMTKLKH